MPSFEPPPVYQSSSVRPRSTSPAPRSSLPRSSASSESLAPPRIVLFSGALEDTFRIPASDSTPSTTWRASRRERRGSSREDLSIDDDPDSIVVIPPLGDREVENDVRRLLGRHGMRARTTVLDAESDPREPLEGAGAGDGVRDRDRDADEMDVDELESDCLSSHAPSRAGSPAPASQLSSGARPLELLRSRPTLLARRESSGPYASSRWGVSSSSSSRHRHRRATGTSREPGRDDGEEEQDVAGMCFDPNGTSVYVASVKGIAEWRIRGAEQRWWTEPEWA